MGRECPFKANSDERRAGGAEEGGGGGVRMLMGDVGSGRGWREA